MKTKMKKQRKKEVSVGLRQNVSFCFCPIIDIQQCVKRGNCKYLILSEIVSIKFISFSSKKFILIQL